jgi:hypothetical protein
MRAGAISATVIIILFGGLAYLELSPGKKPLPGFLPALQAVSSCRQAGPGMRRIGERTGLQFDVPIKDFTISEGSTDAPPPIHVFGIKPENGTAWLSISWGEEIAQTRRTGMPPDPILDSSEVGPSDNVGRRRVLDDKGRTIGEESWGYWGQDERWRRVHLLGQLQVSYGSENERDVRRFGPVHEPDAALFDQIINSVCWLSTSGG